MNASIVGEAASRIPSIDWIVTMGAPVALVALEAIGAAGSSAKVATFDLNLDAANAIKDGKIALAVDAQPYLQGYLAVDVAVPLQDERQHHRRRSVDADRAGDGRRLEHRHHPAVRQGPGHDDRPAERWVDQGAARLTAVSMSGGRSEAAAPASRRRSSPSLIGKLLLRRELSALVAAVAIFALFWFIAPPFRSWAAMATILLPERDDRPDGRLGRVADDRRRVRPVVRGRGRDRGDRVVLRPVGGGRVSRSWSAAWRSRSA